jgi:molecular chaperone GrpE
MRFFRKGHKRRSMEDKEKTDKNWPDELGTQEPSERVRVNDRRRFNSTPDDAVGGEAGAGDAPNLKPTFVEELEARTRAAEQKAADVQARFEQVRADLRRETDEVRQRLARTGEERVAREKANFIAALLPVADNLRRAVEAAEGGGPVEALLEGLRGTLNGFESALVQAGAEPVEAAGQTFDPELHEAVDTTEVEPEREGTVTAQYSRGYRIGNQLLRPARVQVGRAGTKAKEAGE